MNVKYKWSTKADITTETAGAKIPPWRVKKFWNCLGEGSSAWFCVSLAGDDDFER